MTSEVEAYLVLARFAIKMATTVSDLVEWFKGEKARRLAYHITEGDPAYAAIVRACAERKRELLDKKIGG